MTYFIHINRAHLAKNAKLPPNAPCWPVYIVKRGRNGQARYAHRVDMLGPSRGVSPDPPLKCGARAWIETDGEVLLDGRPFEEAPTHAMLGVPTKRSK